MGFGEMLGGAAGGATVLFTLKLKDEYSKELKKASTSFEKFSSVAKGFAIAGAAAVSAFAIASVKSAMESEDVMFKLQQTFGQTADAVAEASERMQSASIYSDETIGTAFISLQTRTKSLGLTFQQQSELIQGAMDLAARSNVDFATAVDAVGAGLTGQTRGLKQLGIITEENASKQDIYNQLLREMASAQGDGEAQSNTLSGSVEKLKNAYDEIQETVGRQLAPYILQLTQYLIEHKATIETVAVAIGQTLVYGIQAAIGVFDWIIMTMDKFILTIGGVMVGFQELIKVISGEESAATALNNWDVIMKQNITRMGYMINEEGKMVKAKQDTKKAIQENKDLAKLNLDQMNAEESPALKTEATAAAALDVELQKLIQSKKRLTGGAAAALQQVAEKGYFVEKSGLKAGEKMSISDKKTGQKDVITGGERGDTTTQSYGGMARGFQTSERLLIETAQAFANSEIPSMNDFIWRSGEGAVSINPDDNIYGYKGEGTTGGGGITIANTYNVVVSDKNEFQRILEAHDRELINELKRNR